MPSLVEEWNLAGDDFEPIAGKPRLVVGKWQLDEVRSTEQRAVEWELAEGDAIECTVPESVARAGDRILALALDVEPGAGFLGCEVIDRGRGDFLGRLPYTKEVVQFADGNHQQLWLAELRLIEATPVRTLSRVLEGALAIRFRGLTASRHQVFGARVRRVRGTAANQDAAAKQAAANLAARAATPVVLDARPATCRGVDLAAEPFLYFGRKRARCVACSAEYPAQELVDGMPPSHEPLRPS